MYERVIVNILLIFVYVVAGYGDSAAEIEYNRHLVLAPLYVVLFPPLFNNHPKFTIWHRVKLYRIP